MKEKLELRLELLKQAINQSMANHNALVGRQQELEETLKHFDSLNAVEEPLKEVEKVANVAVMD